MLATDFHIIDKKNVSGILKNMPYLFFNFVKMWFSLMIEQSKQYKRIEKNTLIVILKIHLQESSQMEINKN